jgi:hypothetical protein
MAGNGESTSRGAIARPRTAIGLEREGLRATAIVIAIIVALVAVLPAIADAVPEPDETVAPGAIVTLANVVRFAPPTGWHIEHSSDPGKGIYVVSTKLSVVEVDAGRTDAASVEEDFRNLQASVRQQIPGAVFVNADTLTLNGLSGIGADFHTAQVDGFVIALRSGNVAIYLTVIRRSGTAADRDDNSIGQMLNSIEVLP